MQQGNSFELPTDEPISVVYTAASWIEAIVVRGLLESAGIPSPGLGEGGYSPDFTPLSRGIPIYTLESQVETAQRVIQEYLTDLSQEDVSQDRDDGRGERERS